MKLLGAGTAATLALSLTACPASVSGEVDGDSVGALISAFFVQDKRDFGEDDLYTVSGTAMSIMGGCEMATKYQAEMNTLFETLFEDIEDAAGDPDDIAAANEAYAEGVVEYEVNNLPTDYWQVSTSVQALDDDLFDGAEQKIDLEDVDDSSIDPTDDEDLVANLSICRVNDHPEVDEPEDGYFVVKRDQDCYQAKKGELVVKKYESDKTFSITAEVELTATDEDGAIDDIDDDHGEVVVNINAGYCGTLEEEIENLKDILEDANG